MEHENPVHVVTFGYLHGAPPSAHLTVDLRVHFRDPHGNPALRHLTARDDAVYEAVRTTPGIEPLLDGVERTVLAYLAGPSAGPITIAIGCAGGRHRAATVGSVLAAMLADLDVPVTLAHRDIAKAVVQR